MKSAHKTNTTQIKETPTFRVRLALALAIFLLAFGVRVLGWHDTRLEVGKVQTVVVADYKRVGQLLREGGIGSFFSSSSPLANLNTLGHPPGYSMLIATVSSIFGSSDSAVQFTQMIGDALGAVMIFLIVAELLPVGAGAIAGMLAAFSPQFAWNSVLLLPDSISVLPILIATYLLARAARNPRLLTFIICGALIGISCWLRANPMLLTVFVAASVPLLIKIERQSASRMLANRRQDVGAPRWQFALAVVGGTLLVILPLTIRNAIVFHRFIPVSLGAGQTLLEGIADYDTQGRFGIPRTDLGIMKQEAEQLGRPDYYGTLFNPDGVERERARLSRGFKIIRSHPLWFASVMARRASSMVRLERSRLISRRPPVSHSLDTTSIQPVWTATDSELLAPGRNSPQAKTSSEAATRRLILEGDDSNYGQQFTIGFGGLKRNTDYLLTAPVQIERGRMRISVTGSSGEIYASRVVERSEDMPPDVQTSELVQLPFVAGSDEGAQFFLSNEASNPPRPIVKLGALRLYELGPASFAWTRYPRLLVRWIQKIFLTAVMLPLAIGGVFVLIFQRQLRALVVMSVVPLYFFTVQSVFHTEYRYVIAVTYFLFAFAGVAAAWVGSFALKKLSSLSRWERARVRV